MSAVFGELLTAGLLLALATLVGYPLGGEIGAVVGFASMALTLFLRQLWQLARLVRWAEQPVSMAGTETPSARGAWERVFSILHRRAKEMAQQRGEIAAALDRFRLAAEAMPDGVVILDGQRAIEWMNSKAETIFAINANQDQGTPITQLMREPEFVDYLAGGYHTQPLRLDSLRNPGHILQIQTAPFSAGRTLLLARDITQLTRLETVRRDFVANVSHELKTPLTVVVGFIETLQDSIGELSAEDTAHYLSLAAEQAGRMQHLVEDLLTLSSLETDRPPQEERIDMAALMQTLAAEARALSAGRHEIQMHAEGPAYLLGSGTEIHSALGNLVSNAVRYTPEGGQVTLRWEARPEVAAFTVEDTGIGIDPRHIPRLTERFYRVDRGRSRDSGGTGLGLAIVKHVLERHQARLHVASEAGRGSQFAAIFPLRRVG